MVFHIILTLGEWLWEMLLWQAMNDRKMLHFSYHIWLEKLGGDKLI